MGGIYCKISVEFVDDLKNLSVGAVKVYLLFKRMSNEDINGDEVWPSYDYIRGHTALGRTSIANGINELIEKGWINNIGQGYKSVNHYHINDYIANPKEELLEKRLAAKEKNSIRTKDRLALVHKQDSSSPDSGLAPVPNVDANNNKGIILTNKNNINNKDNNYSSPDSGLENEEYTSSPETGLEEENKEDIVEVGNEYADKFLNHYHAEDFLDDQIKYFIRSLGSEKKPEETLEYIFKNYGSIEDFDNDAMKIVCDLFEILPF